MMRGFFDKPRKTSISPKSDTISNLTQPEETDKSQAGIPVISDVKERTEDHIPRGGAPEQTQTLSRSQVVRERSDSKEGTNDETLIREEAPKKMSRFKQQRQGLRS